MTYADAAGSDLLSTRVSLLVFKVHLLRIYAIVTEVKLHPKETISMFTT